MEVLAEWLPRIGAILSIILGLVGILKPQLITDNVEVRLDGPVGLSEARAAFGGIHFGLGLFALLSSQTPVYTAIGCAWLCAFLARIYSMVADKTTLQQTMPGFVVDGVLAVLFLSGWLFA